MTNKRKQRARALSHKTGMSHQAAVNVLQGNVQREPTENDLPYVAGIGLVDAPGIDVENYAVAQLLAPYVERAAAPIEQMDSRVTHYVVDAHGVTAHAESPAPPNVPLTVRIDFAMCCERDTDKDGNCDQHPEGSADVHARMVRLSRGPRLHRPPRIPTGNVADFLDALDDVLFAAGADQTALVYMNVEDYANVRACHGGVGSGRLDPNTEAASLRRGYQGELRATTATNETRERLIYVARGIPRGHVHLAHVEMEPGTTIDPSTLVRFTLNV